jgi:hypothetical protein
MNYHINRGDNMKTGRQILKSILSSVARGNKIIERAEFDNGHGRFVKYYWQKGHVTCGQEISGATLKNVKKDWIWEDSYGIKLNDIRRLGEYIRNNMRDDTDILRNLPEIERKFRLLEKLSEKVCRLVKKDDILLVSSQTYRESGIYLTIKNPVTRFCRKQEALFNSQLKPSVSYFIETPLIRFEFPPISSWRGIGNHEGSAKIYLTHKYETSKTEFTKYLAIGEHGERLHDMSDLERELTGVGQIAQQTLEVNSALIKHQDDLLILKDHYKKLNEKIDSENIGTETGTERATMAYLTMQEEAD